jgi:hypothetical protein
MIYAVEDPRRKRNIGEQTQEKTGFRPWVSHARFLGLRRRMTARLGSNATLTAIHGMKQ